MVYRVNGGGLMTLLYFFLSWLLAFYWNLKNVFLFWSEVCLSAEEIL